jgi:hypothetical protein
LLDGQIAASLIGVESALERLAIDFAAAERAWKKVEDGAKKFDASLPMFEAEVGAADHARRYAFFDSHLADERVDVERLVENDPIAKRILELARQSGVTIGFWGGVSRDLLLGRDRDISSDVDLVFDSSEPAFAPFKERCIEELKREHGAKLPTIDFSLDRNPEKKMRGPYRGLTLEKIAILSDGRVFDFTGKGLADLHEETLRFNSNNGEEPGIGSIFRMVGARIQNPTFEFAPETEALIRRVLDDYYSPGTRGFEELSQSYQATRGMGRTELYRWLATQPERPSWIDVGRVVRKMVKGAKDPAFTRSMLERYGLVELLRSIGAESEIAALNPRGGTCTPP